MAKDIAVLFVDIRGFTMLSEQLTPKHVVEMLNEYRALTTEKIFANGGTCGEGYERIVVNDLKPRYNTLY